MNDFSNLNDLPVEIKQLIVNGQSLIDETRTTLQDRKYDFDLTSKRQLVSDCKNVEKCIKMISKGKVNEKNIKKLEMSIVCLRTNLTGIVQFFSR